MARSRRRPAEAAEEPVDPAELLPHGPSFRFVSEVVTCASGSAEARWSVSGDEPFLSGHFPGNPMVPGVLIGEALAQTAGIALHTAEGVDLPDPPVGRLAQLDLKFTATARPPVQIHLSAMYAGSFGSLHQFQVSAHADERALASGRLVLAV